MKILFMGTPDFALASLKALCCAGENVCAVVTRADKPKGRRLELTPPPVKVFAAERGIPVYQPKTLRGEEFDTLLHEIDPEMIVVVAFGMILPENVISYPRFGCINVHGSLLPKYRGAAPMQRAIIDGESVTGITTMYMDAGLDTGDMLLQREVAIEENDNFETVHDKLAECGAELLIETIHAIADGSQKRTKQDDAKSTYAKKIENADCLIDFSLPAKKVHDLIRGLSPIPLAFTHTPDGKLLKITESRLAPSGMTAEKPGTVISTENGITVACGEGCVTLTGVLPEGKGRMSAADFVRGRKIAEGDILS